MPSLMDKKCLTLIFVFSQKAWKQQQIVRKLVFSHNINSNARMYFPFATRLGLQFDYVRLGAAMIGFCCLPIVGKTLESKLVKRKTL